MNLNPVFRHRGNSIFTHIHPDSMRRALEVVELALLGKLENWKSKRTEQQQLTDAGAGVVCRFVTFVTIASNSAPFAPGGHFPAVPSSWLDDDDSAHSAAPWLAGEEKKTFNEAFSSLPAFCPRSLH